MREKALGSMYNRKRRRGRPAENWNSAVDKLLKRKGPSCKMETHWEWTKRNGSSEYMKASYPYIAW